MPVLLAASGLLVDRPFPLLGEAAAIRRRALTMTAMVNLVRIAREADVDGILIVGGLFDDRSVGVRSLAAALKVLESCGSPIFVAPGSDDPYSPTGPFATTRFSDRAYVWTTSEFSHASQIEAIRIYGRARAARWGSETQFPLDADEGPMLAVGHSLPIEPAGWWTGERLGRHVITTGDPDAAPAGVTALAPINGDLGSAFGQAALMHITSTGEVRVERVSVLEGSPRTIELDVAQALDSDELAVLTAATVEAAEPWSVVRLIGALRQGVLLSSVAGVGPGRDDVLVDESAVSFSFTDPNPDDRTATAEFLRSIQDATADERVRHQAIALGLAALQGSARGGASS